MCYDLSLTWQFTKHRHLLRYEHHNGNSKFDNVRTKATHISGSEGNHKLNIMYLFMFANVS